MAKVTIENKEYDLDALSDEARTQVANIAYCDGKLQDLQRETAVLQTARATYIAALRKALPKDA